jgi:alanine dehydrogenase
VFLIKLISILLLSLLLTACARAEGALAPTGVAADVPATSTYALANATIKYGLALANKGWEKALADDAALAKGLNVHEGKIYYEAVAKAHNL